MILDYRLRLSAEGPGVCFQEASQYSLAAKSLARNTGRAVPGEEPSSSSNSLSGILPLCLRVLFNMKLYSLHNLNNGYKGKKGISHSVMFFLAYIRYKSPSALEYCMSGHVYDCLHIISFCKEVIISFFQWRCCRLAQSGNMPKDTQIAYGAGIWMLSCQFPKPFFACVCMLCDVHVCIEAKTANVETMSRHYTLRMILCIL